MKGKTGKSKMRGGGMARKGMGAAMKDGGKAKKMAMGGKPMGKVAPPSMGGPVNPPSDTPSFGKPRGTVNPGPRVPAGGFGGSSTPSMGMPVPSNPMRPISSPGFRDIPTKGRPPGEGRRPVKVPVKNRPPRPKKGDAMGAIGSIGKNIPSGGQGRDFNLTSSSMKKGGKIKGKK